MRTDHKNGNSALTGRAPGAAHRPFLTTLLVLAMFPLLLAAGQTQSGGSGGSDDDGKEVSGYKVQQTIELGYRFTDVTGNPNMYDTLVNQPQGLRLIDQSLAMHATHGTGVLFDDLSVSSFGWG